MTAGPRRSAPVIIGTAPTLNIKDRKGRFGIAMESIRTNWLIAFMGNSLAPERRTFAMLGREYQIDTEGQVWLPDGSAKKATIQPNGYPAYTFENTRQHRRTVRVHVLVAEVFIGPRPAGHHVRHLDDDRRNPRLSNLAYGTPQQNADDARLRGRVARGEGNGQAKLTIACVRAIRRIDGLIPRSIIADWLGVSTDIISKAARGETWGIIRSDDISVEEALRVIFRGHHIDPHALADQLYAEFQNG